MKPMVWTGLIGGFAGAALADFHAWTRAKRVVTWKSLRIALFRWVCGAVSGGIVGAGLGGDL